MTSDTIFREYRISDAERSDRSAGDRLRHREKVRESIRENIADIIAEESIIGKDKDSVIKVPLRGIKEYRFIYGENAPGVGTGDGDARPGQVVGKTGKDGQGKGEAGGRSARRRLLRDRRNARRIDRDHVRGSRTAQPRAACAARNRSDSRSQAQRLPPRRHSHSPRQAPHGQQRVMRMLPATAQHRRERSVAAKAEEGEGSRRIAVEEDALDEHHCLPRRAAFQRVQRRFHSIRTICVTSIRDDTREESNAVVICIMDTSGSMDTMKKYLARSFFFLLYQFISTRYRNVEIVFIAHHTEANEVTEEEFFHKGESGGTFISSGYQKALEIIAERYHPSLWNLYAFHCSDGDNFDSDNPAALRTAEGTVRDLQSVRLRRNQAAGFALLRILDAQRVPPARRAKLSSRADRAQGRHLAVIQGVPVEGSGQGIARSSAY